VRDGQANDADETCRRLEVRCALNGHRRLAVSEGGAAPLRDYEVFLNIIVRIEGVRISCSSRPPTGPIPMMALPLLAKTFVQTGKGAPAAKSNSRLSRHLQYVRSHREEGLRT
jgi:hypothetical protein